MEFTNKYAKLLATKIAGKDEKQITEPVGEKERIFAPNSMNIPTETQCKTKAFTIPPTCDKLDRKQKNVHYITKAEPNTSFVVVIDADIGLNISNPFRPVRVQIRGRILVLVYLCILSICQRIDYCSCKFIIVVVVIKAVTFGVGNAQS